MTSLLNFLTLNTKPAELPFVYSIRRSRRAEKVRLVVKPGHVEVVAPTRVAETAIRRFVEAQQNWVIRTLNRMAAITPASANRAPTGFGEGTEIPYQGQRYILAVKPSKLKRIKIELADTFIAHVPETMPINERSDHIRASLTHWLKNQAKIQVEQLVTHYAPRYRLFPKSVNIRTQKSRWGSCGIHNDIHINWLLLLAPPEVLEYVVVHELCHIRVKNHSSQFWSLVAEHLPSYAEHRRWLKKNGSGLMTGL